MGERGCQVRSARTANPFVFVFFFFFACVDVVGLFLSPSLSYGLLGRLCLLGIFLRLLCALVLTFINLSLDLRSNFDSIIEQAVASRQKGGTTGGTSGNTTTQQTVNNSVSNVKSSSSSSSSSSRIWQRQVSHNNIIITYNNNNNNNNS